MLAQPIHHYIDCFIGQEAFHDEWLCCVIYLSNPGNADWEANSWLHIYPLDLGTL